MTATVETPLPGEVEALLDHLDEFERPNLPPRVRGDLTEVQRRRRAGLLTKPRQQARHVASSGVARTVGRAVRAWGLFTSGATLAAMAAWDLSRPAGLAVGAIALFYAEYRAEKGR